MTRFARERHNLCETNYISISPPEQSEGGDIILSLLVYTINSSFFVFAIKEEYYILDRDNYENGDNFVVRVYILKPR